MWRSERGGKSKEENLSSSRVVTFRHHIIRIKWSVGGQTYFNKRCHVAPHRRATAGQESRQGSLELPSTGRCVTRLL